MKAWNPPSWTKYWNEKRAVVTWLLVRLCSNVKRGEVSEPSKKWLWNITRTLRTAISIHKRYYRRQFYEDGTLPSSIWQKPLAVFWRNNAYFAYYLHFALLGNILDTFSVNVKSCWLTLRQSRYLKPIYKTPSRKSLLQRTVLQRKATKTY